MLGGADNPNGELPSYITGADIQEGRPALVGCEQTFQRAGSKTGQHEDGLTPGIL
ncbi:hypothetical protein JZL99_27005 [Escherichia coli]|nr:hypothetical protein [Escherichia coli]